MWSGAPDPPSLPPLLQPGILIGPEGLRAGWGLLLFVLLTVAGTSLANAAGHWLGLPSPRGPAGMLPGVTLLSRSLLLASVLFTTWVMSRIEGRPFTSFGLGGPSPLRRLLQGAAWGLAALSLLVLLLWAAGALRFDRRLLSGRSLAIDALAWAAAFFAVALLEETLLRGYLQITLARGLGALFGTRLPPGRGRALGFWSTAVLLSVLFGAGHRGNAGESPLGLLSAALAGLVFCYSLWRSGSLWWAIGFHAAWDWAQSFLFGVADSGILSAGRLLATHPAGPVLLSGGTTGPEGSILVVPVLACVALAIRWTLAPQPADGPLPVASTDSTRSSVLTNDVP